MTMSFNKSGLMGLLLLTQTVSGAVTETHRTARFSNDRVSVWETVVYPHSLLKGHRHAHDRVLVALDSGTLKVVSDKGGVSYLNLGRVLITTISAITP